MNVKVSFVSAEMQQDFMSSWGRKHGLHLVWRLQQSGVWKLGRRWTHRVRCHIVLCHFNLHINLCNQGLIITFSNSDAQAGLCAALIKDATEEFGKWRSHVCRFERPYMCKRPLNSKMDHVGNTILKVYQCCLDALSSPLTFFCSLCLQPSALLAGRASLATVTGWSVTSTCWPPGTRPSPSAPTWALTCSS